MAITVTLEGEDEAVVSALVDAAVFPSALAAVQGAVRRLRAETDSSPAPEPAPDPSASR